MKNNRKLAALILAAAMTVTTPYTAWGADVFSAGESFGDGTESIPGILTSILDYGQVGKEYKVQLQADSDVRWSLASGSQLPPGLTLLQTGLLCGVPQKDGYFHFTVQADNNTGRAACDLDLTIIEAERPEERYRLTSENSQIDLGIYAEGQQINRDFSLQNTGTEALHVGKLPESRYFDLSYAYGDEDTEIPTGAYVTLEAELKKNLTAGKYEENLTFTTKEGASCQVTLKVILGASSEKEYDLTVDHPEICFTEDDFYDPEFRVEKYVSVRNSGKKETRISVDASGLEHFTVDGQSARNSEDFEEQDVQRLLKPGESLQFYILPGEEYGTFDETFDFLADDGSRYPVHVTMNRELNPVEKKNLEITENDTAAFPELQWGYKTLPEAKIYTLKNVSDKDLDLTFNRSQGCSVTLSGNTRLAPGESTELRLLPQKGLAAGEHSFQVTVTARTAAGEKTTENLYSSFRVGTRTYQGLTASVEPVTGITNGVAKTAEALHLPAQTVVYGAEKNGEKTTFPAGIIWDVDGCDYDPQNKEAQKFTVTGHLDLEDGENNTEMDTTLQIRVQVDAYQALNRPVFDLHWVKVITNYVQVSLRDFSNEAEGYELVTAATSEDMEKENYTARMTVPAAQMAEGTVNLKYLPAGSHLLYCRAYRTVEGQPEYGPWSEGTAIEVKAVTPETPKIAKTQVKKCDVRLTLTNPQKVDGYDVVAARSEKEGEPIDYVKVQTRYSGDSSQLILKGLPAGIWYIGVHSYTYQSEFSTTKVLSKWAPLQKVTIKTGAAAQAPTVKSVKTSGQGKTRNTTVSFKLPKGATGTDWVLSKQVYKNDKGAYTGVGSYSYVVKNQTKSTITFEKVRPGTYYLTGHAYTKGYVKNFTRWSRIRRIVIK